MKTKDIDINQIKKIHGISGRIKKEIICNFKHQLNTTAENRFKEITFYHDNCNINIKTLCKVFNVSRSGYYAYIKRKKHQKEFKDAKIIKAIRSIQEHYDYIYGINKVRLELIRNHGAILTKGTIARNKVYRLMKENGLLSRCICNKGNSVMYNSHNNIYRNLIKVSTPTSKLFQRFGTDVCEVKTPEGKLYVSVVQEQCCNGLFGYMITKRMTVNVIEKTVDQAMAFVPGTKQVIIHSDRGVLYKTRAYRKLCEGYNLTPSMSRPSTPTDNGQTESIFSCLVREKLRRIPIISMKQVKKEIENYFYFYNYVRINERLGMPPMEYYYRHKDDENLILDLHNKEYSNIYDLIEFAESSSSLETYN